MMKVRPGCQEAGTPSSVMALLRASIDVLGGVALGGAAAAFAVAGVGTRATARWIAPWNRPVAALPWRARSSACWKLAGAWAWG